MNSFFIIAFLICLLCVFAILVTGIVSMARGGAFNEKYGNKLMQARVIMQGIALLMLALAYFTKN